MLVNKLARRNVALKTKNINRNFVQLNMNWPDYENFTEQKEKLLDGEARLKGWEEEKEANKDNIFGKIFTPWNKHHYTNLYKNKLSSAFPLHMYATPWCRRMCVDGIPGAPIQDLMHRLRIEKDLNLYFQPDLYYMWNRFDHQKDEAREVLFEHHSKLVDGVRVNKESFGNWYQEKYRMYWENIYNDPKDWKQACKILVWQTRAYRMAEMDNIVDFLLSFRGNITERSYTSQRAMIHAFGETNLIPDIMHQSIIDNYEHMARGVPPYTIMFYIDISPEEAYDNIQKSDMHQTEKDFYTMDYLRAYQEGYEKFVFPFLEAQRTIVEKIKPEDFSSQDNMEEWCNDFQSNTPGMMAQGSFFTPGKFTLRMRWSDKYEILLEDNIDYGQYQERWEKDMLWEYTDTPRCHPNQKADKLIKWRFPLDCVDEGREWHDGRPLYDASAHEQEFLKRNGYGYAGNQQGTHDKYNILKIAAKTDTRMFGYDNWKKNPLFMGTNTY